jgi:hypothetical protein
MPVHVRAEIPEGFALREFPGGRWQAYSQTTPSKESPIYTRRLKAIQWCLLQIAKEATGSGVAR